MTTRLGIGIASIVLALSACRDRSPAPIAPPPSPPVEAKSPAAAPESKKPPAPTPTPAEIRFTDVTAAAGLTFKHMSGRSGRRYYLEPHSGGCAVLDADGDGLPDIYTVDGGPLPGYEGEQKRSNRLFRNRGDGTFEDVTQRAGVAGRHYGFGALAGDYDGDGDDDIFISNYGPDLLYRNRGDGTFEDVPNAGGASHDGWSTSAAWLDADGDGDLDLYVTRYVGYAVESDRKCWRGQTDNYCTPYHYKAEGDSVFVNQGDGSFVDGSRALGILPGVGKGLGAIAYDFDLDGRHDVYVANDETHNLLYHGRSDGRLEEVGLQWGVAVNGDGIAQAGMGIDAGDIDGDGRPDLVVTNFQHEPINDYRQRIPMVFTDAARTTGLLVPSIATLGFAALLFDVDLDADLDVFIANGHVWDNVGAIESDVKYGQRNFLGRNENGRFTEISSQAGEAFGREDVSRGTCLLDYDADGDLDLLVINLDDGALLLRNDTVRADRHWIGLRFEGEGPNRQAIGARYRVTVGEHTQVGQNWRARGYLSTSQRTVHIGLGSANRVDSLKITWPDGRETELRALAADRVHTVDQRSGTSCAPPECLLGSVEKSAP